MGMTTLYGRGAITISDDRREYRPTGGRIDVPDHLVLRACAAGYQRHPLPELADAPVAEVAAPTAALSSPGSLSGAFSEEAASGSLIFETDGHWRAAATAVGARSYRYCGSAAEYPNDDDAATMGLIVRAPRFAAESFAPLGPDESVFLSIIPFSGDDVTGERLPAIHLTGRLSGAPSAAADPAVQAASLPPAHPQNEPARGAKANARTGTPRR